MASSSNFFADRINELYLDSLSKYQVTLYRQMPRQERVYPHVWSGWRYWRARWSNNFEPEIHREGYYDDDVWCEEPFCMRGAFKGWHTLLFPMRTVYDDVPVGEVKQTWVIKRGRGATTFEPLTWDDLDPGTYGKVSIAGLPAPHDELMMVQLDRRYVVQTGNSLTVRLRITIFG